MRTTMKDMGTQSYLWAVISSFMAWISDHQNLMMLSLAIGIVTACANLYQRCEEGKRLKRKEEREEEIHQAKLARLKSGMDL